MLIKKPRKKVRVHVGVDHLYLFAKSYMYLIISHLILRVLNFVIFAILKKIAKFNTHEIKETRNLKLYCLIY